MLKRGIQPSIRIPESRVTEAGQNTEVTLQTTMLIDPCIYPFTQANYNSPIPIIFSIFVVPTPGIMKETLLTYILGIWSVFIAFINGSKIVRLNLPLRFHYHPVEKFPHCNVSVSHNMVSVFFSGKIQRTCGDNFCDIIKPLFNKKKCQSFDKYVFRRIKIILHNFS